MVEKNQIKRAFLLSSQGSNTLPVGTILPYIGDLSKIPHGWALCDGTSGTPDLINRFLQGGGIAGNFIDAGLPDINGTFITDDWMGYLSDTLQNRGAFYVFLTPQQINKYFDTRYPKGTSNVDGTLTEIHFSASRSNAIYGRSNTVQPAAFTVYYIMRIS